LNLSCLLTARWIDNFWIRWRLLVQIVIYFGLSELTMRVRYLFNFVLLLLKEEHHH
jgi:hypothetical protein